MLYPCVYCAVCRGGRRRFFRAFALASAKPKKERESAKIKKREKSESAEHERKKARTRAFSFSTMEILFSEPKAARQGENRGLEQERQKRTGKVG
jgi:hypothetical protein